MTLTMAVHPTVRFAAQSAIVSALVSMCKSLNAVSIAEGVSTQEECDALLEAGCGIVQSSTVLRRLPRPHASDVST